MKQVDFGAWRRLFKKGVLVAGVALTEISGVWAGPLIEAEDGRYLRAPDGKLAGPYAKQPRASGGKVLAFFQEGRGVSYGSAPRAKWIRLVFATDSRGALPPLEFFDGTNRLCQIKVPDTGSYFEYVEQVFPVDLPACADLRLVAPGLPINIDCFELADGDTPPPLKDPPVLGAGLQLLSSLRKGAYGKVDEILFATRTQIGEHWYANFGYYCYSRDRVLLNTQGRLCAYNIHTRKIRTLVEDLKGAVRDPAVDYDARRIVFSYRPGGSAHYHLYLINADGTGLKQITDGDYDDIEPAWLPDGDIVFVSSRCRRWVTCWLTQVATIYRMHPDGTGLRMLSANIEHDNTPHVMPDGRLLYTRWEYVDRRQVTFHHLWTMNPDGTLHQIYQGNTYPNSVYIDAQPIPGTDEVVLIDSPGHGRTEHQGRLSVLSPKGRPDARANVRTVSNQMCHDPWPFSRDCFMVTTGADIRLFDRQGQSVRLMARPNAYGGAARIFEPVPLMPRVREPVLSDRTDLASKTGLFYLENVYLSRSMDGVKPGTVKKLMVMESLPKPINYTGGMDPLTYGGTFTLTRILGTVPVESDGSAYFRAPALKSLFFVAMDTEGRAVKRMQSFTQVMPGERQGCVGCHERRSDSGSRQVRPLARALQREPSVIDAADRAFDVAEFPRHVQPLLDRACVKCHNPDRRSGGVDLSGDRGVMFSMAYYSLVAWNQVYDGRNSERSDWPPYARGSGGSPLMEKISGRHHGVTVTPAERRLVMQWLDASAPYPGTYAALGCGAIGGYMKNQQVINNDTRRPKTVAARQVIAARCDTCHKGGCRLPHALTDENGISFWTPDWNDPRLKKYHRHRLFNLTRPEKSLFLQAPLAKEGGGLGLCTNAQGKAVFASPDDPGYRALREMIEDGKAVLESHPRFDMPGFRPPEPYLREMKRYGILPNDFDLKTGKVDPYALDRRYWALDWTELK